jgi:hypothetical protein
MHAVAKVMAKTIKRLNENFSSGLTGSPKRNIREKIGSNRVENRNGTITLASSSLKA